jgi:cysteine-rich repeat protein
MSAKTLSRCLTLSLAILLLAAVAPVYAGFGGSATPDFAASYSVGDTNQAVSLSLLPIITGDDTGPVVLTGITLIPSCGAQTGTGTCTGGNEDPGVFSVHGTGTGAAACTGINFTIAQTNATTGEVTFTPSATISLNSLQECLINFQVDVVAPPTKDASGASGVQTAQEAKFAMTQDSTQVGTGTGSDLTQVTFCGDGIIQAPETCDPPGFPGPGPQPGTCRDDCTYCGDAIVNGDPVEDCDDGNGVNFDGCNNECLPETCDVLVDKAVDCGSGPIDMTLVEANDDGTNACSTAVGEPLSITYRVQNPDGGTDNVQLVNCQLTESNSAISGPIDVGTVDVGLTNTVGIIPLICNSTIDDNEPDTATVTCDCGAPGSGLGQVTAFDTLSFACTCPTLTTSLDKSADKSTVTPGETVTYTYRETNTGNGDIINVNVTDDQCSPLVRGTDDPGNNDDVLEPAETWVFTCSKVIDPLDGECIDGYQVTNIVNATGESAIDGCPDPADEQDSATVTLSCPGACRMTGGHVNMANVDSEYDDPVNGTHYTTGGQIGAPNESGCREYPQKGKCVDNVCTGGLNGGLACEDNDDCPNDAGHNSTGPWGDWEHNHHSGPDDTGSVEGGSFAFHSGTAAAPDLAYIKSIQCADPGWCVQARPAPFKQIFWEGTGVFHNVKQGRSVDPLPVFQACGEDQPVPWSKKQDGTLHYYRAHVGDFGEPAGIHQKDGSECTSKSECGTEPGGEVGIEDCALTQEVCEIPQERNDEKSAHYRASCEAQDCEECADWYEIEIHCGTTPDTPVAYRVAHHIKEGNFQIHPPVGDSCGLCGDGICDDLVDENCESCPEDCGPCITIVPTSTSGTWGTR